MSGWRRQSLGTLPVHADETLNWLPHFVQGFTTRKGGISSPPYDTLNLGDHVSDYRGDVEVNRSRLYAAAGFTQDRVALAEQVHGAAIAEVTDGGLVPGVDALATNTPGVLLVLFYADCVPVYLVDPMRRAIALVHAGWRGAQGRIVPAAVNYLQERYGSKPGTLLASIGPCIAGESYEVDAYVADQFRTLKISGAATPVMPRDAFGIKFSLNLRLVLYAQLLESGVAPQSISVSNADTFRDSEEFFSYRRDGGKTGRMAAYLGMPHGPV